MLDIDLKKEKNKFYNYLRNSKKILLINHRRMDWDAYWSLAWFYYILQNIWWYEVKCINDDLTPEFLKFLSQEEIFDNSLDLSTFNADLIIWFDIASIEQMWEMYKNDISYFKNTTFVNIDHHLSNDWFGSINIVDISSSSTCELIWSIIKDFWFSRYMDSKIATFLLTWIITDTNSFFNTNSSANSFLASSELMSYHPKHQEIIQNLFKKKNYNKIKLWWEVLKTLKDLNNWEIVRNTIPKSLFTSTKTINSDISWLLDEFLTTIDWLKVWFLLYELDNWDIKWTFRGKTDDINLNEFCMEFGWWGHSRASGFIISWKTIYEVEKIVIDKLSNIL